MSASVVPAAADARAPEGPPLSESGWVDEAIDRLQAQRGTMPMVHRRGLPALGLLGVAIVVWWLQLLAGEPHLPGRWRAAADDSVQLAAASDPALAMQAGQRLRQLRLADGSTLDASAAWLPRSPRWIVDDAEREQQIALQSALGRALAEPALTLVFDNAAEVSAAPRPRGLGGLGAACWAVCALALMLYLAAVAVVLSRPGLRSALYGLLALSQCVNLMLIGAEVLPGVGLGPDFARLDLDLRLLADATASAALVHLLVQHPRRLRRGRWLALPFWAAALGGAIVAMCMPVPGLWWWAALLSLGSGLGAIALLQLSQRQQRNPIAAMLQRLTIAGTGTLALLLAAIADASRTGHGQAAVAGVGSVIWVVFFAALLMLAPFLSRSKQVLREFVMLAGMATVAASLDLLLVALFSLGQGAALLLALLAALAIYWAARRWIVLQLAGSGALSAEQMFESLYRVAREVEQAPARAAEPIAGLLREIFDPLQAMRTPRSPERVRLAGDGSALVVPIPLLTGDAAVPASQGAIVLRFARRGERLFTDEDRQLTERLIDQLRRAVAYDRAVERGRTEERSRIAQDLHDDIGARLLTLMYRAPNAEIEEYIRHTLQDLKTLTRGLAASSQRLSHAAAEWKADIAQRLGAAGCELHWSFSADRDITLGVVEWSGLTRVLRELVNNIISHAQATRVEINAAFDRGRLTLTVIDDGVGRQPERWSHGLGLGGVRKRVKLLGGQVSWAEQAPRGIRCEVQVSLSGERR